MIPDVAQFLEAAYARELKRRCEREQREFDETWSRHKKIIVDYLDGFTYRELSEKYLKNRTEIYHILKKYGTPIVTCQQRLVKMAEKRSSIPRLAIWSKCDCVTCRWLYARTIRELHKNGKKIPPHIKNMMPTRVLQSDGIEF
jgi:hypothetical protein